jgi:membrane associated rhomboid family serine protease
MLSERDYMQEVRTRPRWPVTIGILILNVLVFIIQYGAERYFPAYPFDDRFALSLGGLKSGYFWQLLTYQFMHASFWHIFFNCWAIYVFGREVELSFGKARMVTLYLTSGVAGGLLQILGSWLLPQHFGDVPVVGASAGAFGLVTAYAVLFPYRQLIMLLFFVVPIKMRARTLLWVSVAIAAAGIIVPFGNIAHAAHLGGILSGYIFSRVTTQRSGSPGASGFY